MTWIDNFLNKITMYRLVLYYLYALIGIAAVFGAIGWLPYNPFAIIVSFVILTIACLLANAVLAKLFRVPANAESHFITAAILTLIITPISFSTTGTVLAPSFATGLWFFLAAAVFAMASKYIFAINRKHLFNPAAIAVVLTGFILGQYASWWVGGNVPLLPFVLIGGLLVVRKIQRFDLALSFIVAAVASIVLTNLAFNPLATVEKAFIHTSILFFAFVMITEPLTTPPTRARRILYGAFIGVIFSPATHLGPFYSTPELALIVGNLFSYAISPKRTYMLTLAGKKEIARDTYEFAFTPGKKLSFAPGQYMEFTIPPNGADLRGNRRYFTIASSPTEPELRLGIKFNEPSSTFKKNLRALKPGDRITAGGLAGDFTLPRDIERENTRAGANSPRKFAFLAGGIGITPFRSMITYLSDQANGDRGEKSHDHHPDITLIYSNRSSDERAYADLFTHAQKTIGIRTIYRDTDRDGRLDAAGIRREIPDWAERMFYLSGPRGLVVAFETALRELGVPRTHIKKDFFPGFA